MSSLCLPNTTEVQTLSSPQTSSSTHQVSKDQAATTAFVLAPALANAALLVAAPSLGCLRTYISALTDLYKANSLPVPDLTLVLGTMDFQFYKEYYSMAAESVIVSNSEEAFVLTSPTPGLPETPVKPSEEAVAPNSTSPGLPKSPGTPSEEIFDPTAPTLGLPETPVRVSSPIKSPNQDLLRPTRRIQRAKTNQELKSPSAQSTIKNKPAQNPFPCPQCERTFRDMQDLRKHLVTTACTRMDSNLCCVTGGWECIPCKKVFPTPDQALLHTRTQGQGSEKICPVCHKDFKKKGKSDIRSVLLKHVNENHP